MEKSHDLPFGRADGVVGHSGPAGGDDAIYGDGRGFGGRALPVDGPIGPGDWHGPGGAEERTGRAIDRLFPEFFALAHKVARGAKRGGTFSGSQSLVPGGIFPSGLSV